MRAFLVFLDESGLLMAPLVRRSWAPQGRTPVLYQRTRSYTKVSVIAALCVAPHRDRVALYFRLHPDRNVRTPELLEFLAILRRQLGGPVLIVWDRLPVHRAGKVQRWIAATGAFDTVHLPPYAPELNPVEYLWAYLKMNPLANLAVMEVDQLATAARNSTRACQRDQALLRSFLDHSPLSLLLK